MPDCCWAAHREPSPSRRRPEYRQLPSNGRQKTAALGHADVVDRAERFLEDLRTHNGRTHRYMHSTIKTLDGCSERANVGRGRPADGPTVVQGMIDDDVVADPRMNGEGYLMPVGATRERSIP